MGDRVSVSFSNRMGEDQSITIFNHWGGEEFKDIVLEFLRELKKRKKQDRVASYSPLGRCDACTLMFTFIGWLHSTHCGLWHDGDYYLGKNKQDGDNSDNGHYEFLLDASSDDLTWMIKHYKIEYIA